MQHDRLLRHEVRSGLKPRLFDVAVSHPLGNGGYKSINDSPMFKDPKEPLMNTDKKTKCPVCGMEVDGDEHQLIHQQMHFAFCSVQCRERFLAHPNLYIGNPGQPAPKQEGQVVLKRRRLRLVQPLAAEDAALVREVLGTLMGVNAVAVSGNVIEFTYDLLQVDLKELQAVLNDAGTRLGGDWVQRLHYALIHESEELQLESHEVAPPHHYLS